MWGQIYLPRNGYKMAVARPARAAAVPVLRSASLARSRVNPMPMSEPNCELLLRSSPAGVLVVRPSA